MEKNIKPKKKPRYMNDQLLEGSDLDKELKEPTMEGPFKPFEDEEPVTLSEGGMCRGAGKAITGKGFKGVF